MKFPIFVQPLGGLCNRMRCIVGAASLAKKTDKKLVIIWTRDATLNAKFSDLFENIPYRVIDVNLASFHQRLIWHSLVRLLNYKVLDDKWIALYARGKDFDSWRVMIADKNLLINSNLDIMFDGDYGIFKIKESLKARCNAVFSSDVTIGVHIRRTDNEKSVMYSPTSLFINKMKEELDCRPSTFFYLATDDPQEEQYFIDEFKEHIIVYKKRSLDRNTPEAIEDAVIDLYNLSMCERIYGSYWSSFSDTAALWGGIEKTVIKKI